MHCAASILHLRRRAYSWVVDPLVSTRTRGAIPGVAAVVTISGKQAGKADAQVVSQGQAASNPNATASSQLGASANQHSADQHSADEQSAHEQSAHEQSAHE